MFSVLMENKQEIVFGDVLLVSLGEYDMVLGIEWWKNLGTDSIKF